MTAERIRAALAEIEATENVRVLYAVESGSRAWGFPSQDSDYDARFLYVRRIDDYLTVDEMRDVIEHPITGDLDVNGWDVRKALPLLRKSNAGLLEWLHSPIVYAEPFTFAAQLRQLAAAYFNPRACMNHYVQLARGNFRDVQGERARLKTYLYVLRSVLACIWIEQERAVPPVDTFVLLTVVADNLPLQGVVTDIIRSKVSGEAADISSPVPVLHDFLAERIAYYTEVARVIDVGTAPGNTQLNALFRDTLREVWGGRS